MSLRENYYENLRQALKRAQTARDDYDFAKKELKDAERDLRDMLDYPINELL